MKPDVIHAMNVLGLTADKIFDRIREDLDRGDAMGARSQLNFVDLMLSSVAESTETELP